MPASTLPSEISLKVASDRWKMDLLSFLVGTTIGVTCLGGILCQDFRFHAPPEILPGIYPGDLWGDLGAALSELQPMFLIADNPLPRAPFFAEPFNRGNNRHRIPPRHHFKSPLEDAVVPSHSQRSVKVLSDLGILNPHQNGQISPSYGHNLHSNYVPTSFHNNVQLKPLSHERNPPTREHDLLHTIDGLIPVPIRNMDFKLSASQNSGHNSFNYNEPRNVEIRDDRGARREQNMQGPSLHRPRTVALKPASNFAKPVGPRTSLHIEEGKPNIRNHPEGILKNHVNARVAVLNIRPSSYNRDSWKSSTQVQGHLSDSVLPGSNQESLNSSDVAIYTDFKDLLGVDIPVEHSTHYSNPENGFSYSEPPSQEYYAFDSPSAKPFENPIKDVSPPDLSKERQHYPSRSLVTTRRPNSAPFVASRFRNAPQNAPRQPEPQPTLSTLETPKENSVPQTVEVVYEKASHQEDLQDNSKVLFDDEVRNSSFVGSSSISSSVKVNANAVVKPIRTAAKSVAKPLAKKKPKRKQQKVAAKEPEEEEVVPGIPGQDYPTFSDIPDTRFKCDGPGFYADLDTGCQVFHNCDGGGQKHSFLCPNGTVFRQELFICDWWYNVRCELSQEHFPLNDGIFPSKTV